MARETGGAQWGARVDVLGLAPTLGPAAWPSSRFLALVAGTALGNFSALMVELHQGLVVFSPPLLDRGAIMEYM